jgi:hypothetical protein
MTRFRQNDELSAFVTTPACGNGDAIFIVDEVTKFAGVEELSLRKRLHRVSGELVHFDPLSSTFNHFPCQDVNKKLKPHFAATLPTRKPRLRRELGPGYARSTIACAFSAFPLRRSPSARLRPKPGNRLQLRFSRKADRLFDF